MSKALPTPAKSILRRLVEPQQLLLVLGGLVIAIMISAATAFILQLRMAAIDNAEKEMGNLSAALAEQTARSFQSAELILAAVESGTAALDLSRQDDVRQAHELLLEKIAGVPQIKYATIIGADGNLLVSSFGYPTLSVRLGDRPYFTAHRENSRLPLYIAEPVQSRTTAEWLIFVSRRRPAPDSSFAGVFTMALDPNYFEDVYQAATRTQGASISLLRRDGVLLARHPRIDRLIGTSYAAGPFFRDSPDLEAGRVFQVFAEVDQQYVIVAPRAVRGYPLVVRPSVRVSAILNEWRRQAWVVAAVAAIAATAVFVLLLLLRNQIRHVAAANTALRASEEDIRQQATRLSTLIENLPVGVSLVGRDLRHLAFNRQFLDVFDLTPEMLKPGDPFEKLIRINAERGEYGPGDIDSLVRKRVEHAIEPSPDQFERKRPDGRIIDIRRVPLPGGGFVTTYADLTDRRKLEQQLIQAQKMEAVGQLGGGVAHDFNNILAVIIGNLEEVIEIARDRPDERDLANRAMDAAERGAELVHRLLAFSRNQPLQPRPLELGLVLAALDPLVRRSLGEQITIETRIPSGLWMVMADPAQFENAVLNLAINARDAMPGGGRLSLVCANTTLDDSGAASVDLPTGDYVTLTVSDTGTGITPEQLPKVFEPFFTTKEVGKGSGLGLSMVYGFSRQSGGTVKIYSEVGHGTDVRIYLPRATAATAMLAVPEKSRTLATGAERILVVEDRPEVREVAIYNLSTLGYRTKEAENAAAALALFDRGEIFDLLFTDLVMPGLMNGIELAREARRRFPSLAIVFTSGFSDPQTLANEASALSATIVTKPYRKVDLAEHIRTALDRRATS